MNTISCDSYLNIFTIKWSLQKRPASDVSSYILCHVTVISLTVWRLIPGEYISVKLVWSLFTVSQCFNEFDIVGWGNTCKNKNQDFLGSKRSMSLAYVKVYPFVNHNKSSSIVFGGDRYLPTHHWFVCVCQTCVHLLYFGPCDRLPDRALGVSWKKENA